MAPARRALISWLASTASFAAAQPTCAEGPQLDGDGSALLQLSGFDEPPPCLSKACGDDCFNNRQNKMGVCNLAHDCDTSGKSNCNAGPGAQDMRSIARYCSLPSDRSCYKAGWPSCCLEGNHCTTRKKPVCDKSTMEEDVRQVKFELVGIGSCKTPQKFIGDKSQCQAAANSLGYNEIVQDASLSRNPYGCYFKGNNGPGRKLWFNPYGRRDSQDHQRLSICVSQSRSQDFQQSQGPSASIECENKTCGFACGGQGACSATGMCMSLSRASEFGCEAKDDYMLVSIEDYNIEDSADTDNGWWDYADVVVEVVCRSTHYMSKVYKDQNRGNLGLHFYVHRNARSDSCTLYLHDDDGGTHETILKGTIPLDRLDVDGHFEVKQKTCYFGGFCSTSLAARVGYSIASGARAKSFLSSGELLTPGTN